MAKFVHVDADRVRSGMRRLEALLADDDEWNRSKEQFELDADELRVQRDREFEELVVARRRQGVIDPDRRSAHVEAG